MYAKDAPESPFANSSSNASTVSSTKTPCSMAPVSNSPMTESVEFWALTTSAVENRPSSRTSSNWETSRAEMSSSDDGWYRALTTIVAVMHVDDAAQAAASASSNCLDDDTLRCLVRRFATTVERRGVAAEVRRRRRAGGGVTSFADSIVTCS